MTVVRLVIENIVYDIDELILMTKPKYGGDWECWDCDDPHCPHATPFNIIPNRLWIRISRKLGKDLEAIGWYYRKRGHRYDPNVYEFDTIEEVMEYEKSCIINPR